jgi:hypothetical protein
MRRQRHRARANRYPGKRVSKPRAYRQTCCAAGPPRRPSSVLNAQSPNISPAKRTPASIGRNRDVQRPHPLLHGSFRLFLWFPPPTTATATATAQPTGPPGKLGLCPSPPKRHLLRSLLARSLSHSHAPQQTQACHLPCTHSCLHCLYAEP